MITALLTVAGCVALALYVWKVLWPGMRENFQQLARSEHQLGPVKFWGLMAFTVGFIGLFAWLATRLDYPNAYDHRCSGRGCLFQDIYYSPLLLRTHRWDELALFICLALLPASLVAAGIYALVRKLRGTKFSIYSDPQE